MRLSKSLFGRLSLAIAVTLIALVASLSGHSGVPGVDPAEASPSGNIVLIWGVGGVLTGDGKLWQYRPESRHWVTVDQSFALDGERRKVLPLPVPPGQIEAMQGFGFIVTKAGSSWLYNLDSDKWENIGAPGRE
jgi:hypothetical protein